MCKPIKYKFRGKIIKNWRKSFFRLQLTHRTWTSRLIESNQFDWKQLIRFVWKSLNYHFKWRNQKSFKWNVCGLLGTLKCISPLKFRRNRRKFIFFVLKIERNRFALKSLKNRIWKFQFMWKSLKSWNSTLNLNYWKINILGLL